MAKLTAALQLMSADLVFYKERETVHMYNNYIGLTTSCCSENEPTLTGAKWEVEMHFLSIITIIIILATWRLHAYLN